MQLLRTTSDYFLPVICSITVYGKMMLVYLQQITSLQQEDPVTWRSMKDGAFVVAKTGVLFTLLFTDQALEQEIKELKGHGVIVGLSQDERTLDRLVTITPHLACIIEQYLQAFPRQNPLSANASH